MGSGTPTIPRFEPEMVQAHADRCFGGDTDKVPTTSLAYVDANGIRLESRYGKAHEYEEMAAMVASLPSALAMLVRQIHCDSDSGVYWVMLPTWDRTHAVSIGREFERVCVARSGGHGGITVAHGTGVLAFEGWTRVEMAPHWVGWDEARTPRG